MYYREDKSGQILEEGINEGGALCSWIAAGTSYSNHDVPMVPFYIYYSMFGFQRIGDFVWAGGDMQSRGFLIGGTAGRTTLAGEGLQHQDGHSLVAASTVPNCHSYDPTYAYELAVIVQDGLRRMIGEQEDVFYYITCMNENYTHPPMPAGVEDGILRGMYLLDVNESPGKIRVQLMGSVLARSYARFSRPPNYSWMISVFPPMSGLSPVSMNCAAMHSRSNAGITCTRTSHNVCRTSRSASVIAPDRISP